MDERPQHGKAPEVVTTERLVLRRPRPADAPAILASYAGDPDVTRLLAWPRHRSIEDTLAFLRWSDRTWASEPAGPYLVVDHHEQIVGTTGLDVETPWRAATGYVLRRDAWGQGFATEIVRAIAELADSLQLVRLYALCHPGNRASARVLAKAGFRQEGLLRRHTVFPNADSDGPQDVECWARVR